MQACWASVTHTTTIDIYTKWQYNKHLHTEREFDMGYIISFLLGIFVATVGISGVASVADKGVNQMQNVMKDAAK